MEFDYDILFDFLSEEDKKSFMVWDNVELTQKYSSIPDSIQAIVATYRVRYVFDEERIIIPLDEYELRVKEKQREEKLNKIL
jgi:hypothetical protein